MVDSRKRLLDYYARTADQYDGMHGAEPEHALALELISGLAGPLGFRTVLDVGTGTGRGFRVLSSVHGLQVVGIDLSLDLLKRGVVEGALDATKVCVGDATRLPFPDKAFDLVVETGILHHVPDPSAVISEMLRTSRIGIAISDNNMYVAGDSLKLLPKNIVGAALKMALCKSGLWRKLKKLVRGHEWSYSEGDGVFWTYSIYDSIVQIQRSCRRVWAVPLAGGPRMNEIPLLDASHVLLVAVK